MNEINSTQKVIRYKKLEHERVEDAPFVGALISACDCRFNCKNCFNQHLKQLPTMGNSPEAIIKEVLSNPFNKGIIFGGLEWTLQFDELVALAKAAKENGLKTMLYTGRTFNSVEMYQMSKYFDYIKCGRYREDLATANHIEYGVTLASANQHIYKGGKDF